MADHDKSKKTRDHWPLRVFLIAVSLSAVMSFCSSAALEDSGIWIPILVLAIFIALGIVFDMIGVAVTAADPKPFHSMAAHGEKGGREAIRLLNMSSAAPPRRSSSRSCSAAFPPPRSSFPSAPRRLYPVSPSAERLCLSASPLRTAPRWCTVSPVL